MKRPTPVPEDYPHTLSEWDIFSLLNFYERLRKNATYCMYVPSHSFLSIWATNEQEDNEFWYRAGIRHHAWIPLVMREAALLLFFTKGHEEFESAGKGEVSIYWPLLSYHFRKAVDEKLEMMIPFQAERPPALEKPLPSYNKQTLESVMNEIPPEPEPL
jgi:hypothetical protein